MQYIFHGMTILSRVRRARVPHENIAHAVYHELFIEMLAQYNKNLDNKNKIDEYKEISFCKVKIFFQN